MRNSIGATLILVLSASAIGCASKGAPVTPAQLADTEATIRSAEAAGAFERAPDLLQKARQALGAAQQASGRGDHERAREHLLETTTYADAARARAHAEQKKREAVRVQQEADELEGKVNAVRQQLQTP